MGKTESDLGALSWMVEHLEFLENTMRTTEGQKLGMGHMPVETVIKLNEYSHKLAARHLDDPFVQRIYEQLLRRYEELKYPCPGR